MLRYIFHRLLILVPIVIGISFIVFAILSFTPGDPVMNIVGNGADAATYEAKREELGLNDPFLVRYINYMKGVLSGDLGSSWNYDTKVSEELGRTIPKTLILAITSVGLMLLIGMPIGIISAVKQYSIWDNLSMAVMLIITSMPLFWLGLMLMLQFAVKIKWFPATFPTEGLGTVKHWILPTVTCMASMMAALVRTTRSTMLEVIRSDYIRTAKAKGATEKNVITKHALRNALLPVVTLVGLNFGLLMGGALVTEKVFGIYGVGYLLVNAVTSRDVPLVMGSILFVATCIGVVNLFVDVLYAYIDPRLRSQYVKINTKKSKDAAVLNMAKEESN